MSDSTRKRLNVWSFARQAQFLADIAVLSGAFWLAYALRFDFAIPPSEARHALVQMPFVVLLQFVVILLTGIYAFVWRYVGMSEIPTFVHAAVYSALPILLARFTLPDAYQEWRVPLSVIVLDTALAFGGILGIRVLRRWRHEANERQRREANKQGVAERVLLVGAGRAGMLAAREIQGRGDLDLEPVGFVDDDPLKSGAVIQGLRVLGTTDDLPRLVDELHVAQAIITIAEAAPATLQRIVTRCKQAGVRVRTIPGMFQLLQGSVSISRFQDVAPEDLLGRDPVELDQSGVAELLQRASVLVTGAGGSIGSELARQVADHRPAKLVLVERSEAALFEIEQELRRAHPELALDALVVDIADQPAMERIFERSRPSVVVHAAAHKHVPMMEFNASEAVKNNALATASLGELAGRTGVGTFVLISTDKAVSPSSVMGATKRVAELAIQDLATRYENTRFVAVRFGNVLGSTGSVIPMFQRQIESGGPVTITHPDATRYFMTTVEASQLVLEAGALCRGGEIMILDMGEPVRILDIAQQLIRLSGYEPFDEIPIRFVGLRPGEKLHEQLRLDAEAVGRTHHPKIFVGRSAAQSHATVVEMLRRLDELAEQGADSSIRAYLVELLPDAQLSEPPSPAVAPLLFSPRRRRG